MATVPNRTTGTVDPDVTGDDRPVRTEPPPRLRQLRLDGDPDELRPSAGRRPGRRQRRVRETDDGQLVFYL
jgi:hypothetical protein